MSPRSKTPSPRTIVSPSILAADMLRLHEAVETVVNAGAQWIHVDVMDGHFVPNLTFGLPMVESLRRAFPKLFLDVHLMVTNPDEVAHLYAQAGASLVTFHAEAATHGHRLAQSLKDAGCQVGVALNPGSPVELVAPLIEWIDLVLVMSVNPGFAGQKFITSAPDRVARIAAMVPREKRASFYIQVDGGINEKTAAAVCAAGANALVAGSYIFAAKSIEKAVQSLLTAGAPHKG